MTRLIFHADGLRMALLAAILLATPVHAGDAIPWSSLTTSEQTVLEPFRERWESMTAQRQQRLQSLHQHGISRRARQLPFQSLL